MAADVSVNVDGTACAVTATTDTTITCVTGTASAASTEGAQPGAMGLKHTIINPTDDAVGVEWTDFSSTSHTETVGFNTAFETRRDVLDQFGNLL